MFSKVYLLFLICNVILLKVRCSNLRKAISVIMILIMLTTVFSTGFTLSADESTVNSTPILQYAHNRSFASNEHIAYVTKPENCYKGNYCLAFGFTDTGINSETGKVNPINAEVSFRVAEEGNSGDTFTIKFALKRVGYVRKGRIVLSEHGNEGTELVQIENIPENSWQEFTFTYTDTTNYTTSNAHSYLYFRYYTTAPDANSGILIDDIQVTQNSLGENAPNLVTYGDFEVYDEEYPQIDWSADSTFWGKDVFDLSFMNNLPNNVAAYGVTPIKGTNNFFTSLNDPTFCFYTDYMISEESLELCKYLARKFTDKNRNIWITVEDIICNSDKSLKENWQALLMQYASHMQAIAGNRFQGFYFDEPSMDFKANDFLTVTEYCRTTFRKRVLVVHKSIAVNPPANYVTEMAILDPDTHKYITDIGYWKYDTWGGAGEATLNKFKETMTSDKFNSDVRKWIVPIIGRNHPCQTEEDICTLIENMVYGAMEMPNFGGVALYAMCYRIVEYEKGTDEKIEAAAEQLLSDGIIWEHTNANGVSWWKSIEANGVELLRRDSETGLAPWNNCLTLVESIAATLYGQTVKNYEIVNGVAIIDNETTTVNDFGINAAFPRRYYNFYRNNSRINGKTLLSTGDEFRASPPDTVSFKYTVAVKNDTNCDGKFNILDIVRTKKASVGTVDFTAAQYAALGIASPSDGVNATKISELRNELMN